MNSLNKLIEAAQLERTIISDRFGNSYLFIEKRRLLPISNCPPYQTGSVALSVIYNQNAAVHLLLFQKMKTWGLQTADNAGTTNVAKEITNQITRGNVALVCLGS